jgi:3',5'-cyclic-AMP phosphodiesterase
MPTHVIGQCSDLHLDGGRASGERARQVLRHFRETAVDLAAVVITGDLTADGRAEEYAQLADLLADVRHPVVTCPGNHDDRATYREILLGEPRDDTPVNRAHRLGDLVVLSGDSTLPGQHGGLLTDDTLEWFDAELTATDRSTPVVLAFHHPPVILHSPILDGMRQQGAERLEALLDRHRHAVAVLVGHAHTAAATTFAGRPLRVCPGVISTLTLPWETGDLLDVGQPPGLAFHVLDTPNDTPNDGWRLVTHYRTLT